MPKPDSSPRRLPGQRSATSGHALTPEIMRIARGMDGSASPADVELTQRLVEEDVRIATALGDTVVRHLFAIGLRMQSLQSRAGDGLQDELAELVEDLDETIREMRRCVLGLDRRRSSRSGES